MTVLFLLLMLTVFLTADHFVQRFRARKMGLVVRERVTSLLDSFNRIPAGVELALNHTWMKRDAGPVVTVGLDEFITKFFGTVGRIVLPEAGLSGGKILIEDGERSLALAMPVSGRVVAVNTRVLNTPSAAHDDPYGSGWLVQIQPDPGESRRTLVAPQALQWLKEQAALARDFFAGKSGAGEFAMMQDGGILVDGILKLYDGAVWAEFRDKFLTVPADDAAGANGTM